MGLNVDPNIAATLELYGANRSSALPRRLRASVRARGRFGEDPIDALDEEAFDMEAPYGNPIDDGGVDLVHELDATIPDGMDEGFSSGLLWWY